MELTACIRYEIVDVEKNLITLLTFNFVNIDGLIAMCCSSCSEREPNNIYFIMFSRILDLLIKVLLGLN